MNKVIEVNNLCTEFQIPGGGNLKAVNNVSFTVNRGETLGVVGESGSGKSVTVRSIMRLIPPNASITGGKVFFEDKDLLTLSEKKMAHIRGNKISIIFQNPATSFNPLFTIGKQMKDSICVHEPKISSNNARRRGVRALQFVGIKDAKSILSKYPCEFTSGFLQRIAIAMSMLCKPKLIIADEPTTNLGLSVQRVILASLKRVQAQTGAAIIFITHDFGVIAQLSDKIQVMYAGRIVETGYKMQILTQPLHPYTRGLLTSVPSFNLNTVKRKNLKAIRGFPPNMLDLPPGCSFEPRCSRKLDKCGSEVPPLKSYEKERTFACFNPESEVKHKVDAPFT